MHSPKKKSRHHSEKASVSAEGTDLQEDTQSARSTTDFPRKQESKTTKSSSSNRWLLAGIGSLLTVSLMLAATWIVLGKPQQLIGQPASTPGVAAEPTAVPTPSPEDSFSVLVMGRGGAGHDGGALTDTMLVAKILLESKRVVMISIPRDLWVEIPYWPTANAWGKINSAYAIGVDSKYTKDARYSGPDGGIRLAGDVISTVTGLSIDKTVVIDFSGFEQAIDQLGGVDIQVERAFADFEYPIRGREKADCTQPQEKTEFTPKSIQEEIEAGTIQADTLPKLPKEFPCRYEALRFAAGLQHMDGKTALKYVRSRHSAEEAGDFSRSRRQRLLIQAVIDRLFSLNQLTKIPAVFSTIRNHVDTDLSVTDIAGWIPRAQEIRSFPITSLTLSTDNYVAEGYTSDRQFVLKPLPGEGNYEQIHNWIQSSLRTDTALKYPTIEVQTANRKAGDELVSRLKAQSLPTRLTIVQRQATTSATIVYRHANIAQDVQGLLNTSATISAEFGQYNQAGKFATDVRILLP